jgi:hypothetical protein
MAWVVSQLNERVDVSAFFGSVRRSSPAVSTASIPQPERAACFAAASNETTYRCSRRLSSFPTDYAWGPASDPTEVSGQVALVGESR